MKDNSTARFGLLLLSALILVSDTFAFCGNDQFTCGNGNCIRESWQCDNVDDCGDGSDELSCVCYNNFGCNNGNCVTWSYKCDGDNDCLDNSDEWGCFATTTRPTTQSSCPGEFRCSSGSCISLRWVCDGDDDCLYGDDEYYSQCPTTIRYGRVTFGGGSPGFNYGGVIGGVCAGVAVVVIIIVMSIIKMTKTTPGQRRTGPAVGIAVTTASNGMHHQPPPKYPGGPAMHPNQPGFGAPQAYPNGYSAHPGGYPMTGMGPHPGVQPGPYGAPPGVNPPPYPGVQQHQPPMAAGYPGTTQAPQQQPPMASGFSGTQAPQQHTQQASGPIGADTSIPEDDRLYAANQAHSIQPVTTAEVRHVQPAPDTSATQ